MGRPPSNGAPAFRFNPAEVAQMETVLREHEGQIPARELLVALAEKFSNSPERAGKITVQMKQVWNWFQNRRYALRSKLVKSPGNLNVSSMPREEVAPVRNVAPVPHQIHQSGHNVVRSASETSQMEFEAKSARDGAWYDVQAFLSHRYLETGNPEVLVRFAGFGPEEDEWVNIRKHVRQRSLPCEASECVAVLPGDLILCFQEGKEQALYFDAHVLDAQRRRHDIRGCRCRFLVRYDHDQSEEIVPLRKICRRPETDYRLQQLHAANEAASASVSADPQKQVVGPTSSSTVRVMNPNVTVTALPVSSLAHMSSGASAAPSPAPAPAAAPGLAPTPAVAPPGLAPTAAAAPPGFAPSPAAAPPGFPPSPAAAPPGFPPTPAAAPPGFPPTPAAAPGPFPSLSPIASPAPAPTASPALAPTPAPAASPALAPAASPTLAPTSAPAASSAFAPTPAPAASLAPTPAHASAHVLASTPAAGPALTQSPVAVPAPAPALAPVPDLDSAPAPPGPATAAAPVPAAAPAPAPMPAPASASALTSTSFPTPVSVPAPDRTSAPSPAPALVSLPVSSPAPAPFAVTATVPIEIPTTLPVSTPDSVLASDQEPKVESNDQGVIAGGAADIISPGSGSSAQEPKTAASINLETATVTGSNPMLTAPGPEKADASNPGNPDLAGGAATIVSPANVLTVTESSVVTPSTENINK